MGFPAAPIAGMTSERVGILGGGQLGLMMGLAARTFGVGCRFYDTGTAVPAAAVGYVVDGTFEDDGRLAEFAAGLEVVTYEFENVPVSAARAVERVTPVCPPTRALEVSQDRVSEKDFARGLGMETVEYQAVDTLDDLLRAVAAIGTPAILKTRRLGYDGRGQMTIAAPTDARRAWEQLGGTPLILERRVALDRELSVIGVRGRDGSIVQYPLVENRHRDGILRVSTAPADRVPSGITRIARDWMTRALEALDYVGVLAIELFQVNGRLLVNEIAPRVHNSGHWTIEGAATSQFENHIRAILGLPLGSTAVSGPSRMVNIIGNLPANEAVLAVPDAHLHLYGKAPRPGRKLGHVTVRATSSGDLEERSRAVLRAVAPELV